MRQSHGWAYGLAILANGMLPVLLGQMERGELPIPATWAWVVPLLTAGITGLMAFLPQYRRLPPKPPRPSPHG